MKSHRCYFCGGDFESIYLIRSHVKAHISEVEMCPLCGRKTNSLKTLLIHCISYYRHHQDLDHLILWYHCKRGKSGARMRRRAHLLVQ